jgi:hypothetical protein
VSTVMPTGASPQNKTVRFQEAAPEERDISARPGLGECEDKHTNYYEVLIEEDDVKDSSMLAQANGTDREILCCGVNSSDTRETGSTEADSIFPNTQELQTNTKSIRGEDRQSEWGCLSTIQSDKGCWVKRVHG